jgi:hypothetical protein
MNKHYTATGTPDEVIAHVSAVKKSALDLLEQILNGNLSQQIIRKDYAVGMIYSALIAKMAGYNELLCLEFGVAPGSVGLKDLHMLAYLMKNYLGVSYEIHGFDRKEGMPKHNDYKDHPELWTEGSWGVNTDTVPENVIMHIGDVADTVPEFTKSVGDKVIGFVSFDLDQYTGTKHALDVLTCDNKNYLPVVPVYVDDLDRGLLFNPWQGCHLAVNEFNEKHDNRKIDLKFQRLRMVQPIGFLHVFDHDIRTGVSQSLYPLDIGII